MLKCIVLSLNLLNLYYVSAQYKCSLPLEAENGHGVRKQPRSEASGGFAVTMYQNEEVVLVLHLSDTKNTCYMLLLSVTYSNDGPSDTINVLVNETLLGSFNTTAEYSGGQNWNIFYQANIKSPLKVRMSDGQSKLKILAVATDRNGVEIDYLLLELYCPHKKVVEECPLQPVPEDNCLKTDSEKEYNYLPTLEILSLCGLLITVCGIASGYCFFAIKLIVAKNCCGRRKSIDNYIEMKTLSLNDCNKQTDYKLL